MQIEQVNAAAIREALEGYAALLQAVVNGGASVSFIAPLNSADATAYWMKIAEQVDRDERVVLIAREGAALAGCIHLVPATTPNGLHRAEVQKMLVHPDFRRRGLGRALLGAAEQAARDQSKSLLVLDTERDSAGEALYSATGWTKAGIIPQFAASFDGTHLVDTVVFYKILR